MAKKKRGPIKDPITFAKLVLRGASIRWYARTECINRARISRGVFKCAQCDHTGKKNEFQVDHIDPVSRLTTGFETMEEFVRRLFVEPEALQLLCISCHQVKSALEQEMRKHYKKQNKKLAKKSKKDV
jgi:5-methylcytosine-specific restriction endonuclease McrA